ncbi:YcgJ family protein [Verminephrobacter aporrectodeae]|uniref:YcgJ family protein n=1 Tax=Verminephrobacter aporrectodeae TaxID=1110389 RepID=UPI0022446310|nr:YcgJ family protein [Verminephrobacter aporrectodeae]
MNHEPATGCRPGSGLAFSLALLLAVSAIPAHAGRRAALRAPEPGVLCDRYVCANDQGISRSLTEKYLGKKTATKLFSQGDFDLTEFTFANGIFCDTKERLCRRDRYYGADGKRSGAVSGKYTKKLFGP